MTAEIAGLDAVELIVDGYLPKAAVDENLGRAIRAVADGERYVHPSLGAALAAPAASAGPIEEPPTASARCCACSRSATPTRRSPRSAT